LVPLSGTITASEDKNRTLPTSTVEDPIDYRLLNEIAWPFHGFAIVGRAPTAAINSSILKTIVQGSGFVDV
jgi:hypothetical protein